LTAPPENRLPNFLYIGPDRAGSTWTFQLLVWHPQVLTPAVKELFFFDRNYQRGLNWYAKHFPPRTPHTRILAELSHDYLYSPEACDRIADRLPGVRVMVCLREPVDRAFSAYLNMLRHGLVPNDFAAAIKQEPGLIEHGRYAEPLQRYIEHLGRDRVYVAVFDDLEADPGAFASQLFDYLGVDNLRLPEEMYEKALPAGVARFGPAARVAKQAALIVRQAGFPELVGRVKSSAFVQRTLYKALSNGSKPQPDAALARQLKDGFRDDVAALDAMLGTQLTKRWGYDS
jgi:hypothetical protein